MTEPFGFAINWHEETRFSEFDPDEDVQYGDDGHRNDEYEYGGYLEGVVQLAYC